MENRYEFIVALVKEAGNRILEAKEKNFEVNTKNEDRRDFVTSVDLEINEFLTSKIQEKFPDEVVLSEETDVSPQGDQSYWSVDPIDGTSNFARGIPHYAVVISFLVNEEPVVGAIYNPVTKDLFSFEKDKGSFLNDKPIHVTQISDLKEAYVLLHIGRNEKVREWGLTLQKFFLGSAKKNINLGSSALDLAYLACGRVDAVIYGTMTTIDVAVATALLREAGGEVYSLNGDSIKFTKDPQQIIATATKELFEEIKKI
jgi:myo-inositol-1(or 4)-monophosphatase